MTVYTAEHAWGCAVRRHAGTTGPPDDLVDDTTQGPPADLATTERRRMAMFGSLAQPDFRRLVVALLVTSTGTWVQRIAQDWLVLSTTHSATAVGLTTMCQLLPMLLFGLAGGAVADRYPRRSVLIVTQSTMCGFSAVLAAVVLTDHVVVWQIDAIAFALGVAASVDIPARQALTAELVNRDHVRNAVSIVSSVFQLGATLGPALAGVLLGTIGAGYCFAINAASFLGVIVVVVRLRRSPRAQSRSTIATAQVLSYVRRRSVLSWPTVLVGAYGLFTYSLPVTLAAYARTVFDNGPAGYALFSSVVAIGSMAGALLSWLERTGRAGCGNWPR